MRTRVQAEIISQFKWKQSVVRNYNAALQSNDLKTAIFYRTQHPERTLHLAIGHTRNDVRIVTQSPHNKFCLLVPRLQNNNQLKTLAIIRKTRSAEEYELASSHVLKPCYDVLNTGFDYWDTNILSHLETQRPYPQSAQEYYFESSIMQPVLMFRVSAGRAYAIYTGIGSLDDCNDVMNTAFMFEPNPRKALLNPVKKLKVYLSLFCRTSTEATIKQQSSLLNMLRSLGYSFQVHTL